MQTPAPFNSSSQPPTDLIPSNFVPSMPTSTPPFNPVWDLRTAQGSPVIMSPGLSSHNTYPPAQAIRTPSTQPFGAESDLTHNKPAPAVASSPSAGTSAETSTASYSHETTIERGEGCRACSVDHKTVSTSSLAKEAAESGFSASSAIISIIRIGARLALRRNATVWDQLPCCWFKVTVRISRTTLAQT